MVSLLQKHRLSYRPDVPFCMLDLNQLVFRPIAVPSPRPELIKNRFPHTHALHGWSVVKAKPKPGRPLCVGVLFSGGQAAGGHNVIAGIFDGLRQIHPDSHLIGFLNGPAGLIDDAQHKLTAAMVDNVRNLGGFDLIGSGRTKIETSEQFLAAARQATVHRLDALVIIGGDDSNTNAALLSEYFLENQIATSVIGVPKTIDGDLRSADIEISFGFDSATKTYSELIGNIARDALSAKKYYHFIKLMGRSASHIALECALATHPNLTLIGEENQNLSQIVSDIAQLIIDRKNAGKEYGIVLLPEGLIEFIPEFKEMIAACNKLLGAGKEPHQIKDLLAEPHRSFFCSLPEKIQQQLVLDRDPHGNVQVSQIETDLLILDLVKRELDQRKVKFHGQNHFFGYEGRSCFPSNFDSNYCYALGLLAALAARESATGVILAIKNLHRPVQEWEPKAVPIVQLMGFEIRSGKEKPVISKALVDLQGKPYRYYSLHKSRWMLEDDYQMPGPIQFFGDPKLTNSAPFSLSF
jgi:diphosphate-dependent phosphofructokinase